MKLFHSISAALLFALAQSLTAAPVEQFTLAKPGGRAYGEAIVLSGDTLVVGDNGNGAGPGVVHVSMRSGGTWTQQAVLTPSNGDQGDRFGEPAQAALFFHQSLLEDAAPATTPEPTPPTPKPPMP